MTHNQILYLSVFLLSINEWAINASVNVATVAFTCEMPFSVAKPNIFPTAKPPGQRIGVFLECVQGDAWALWTRSCASLYWRVLCWQCPPCRGVRPGMLQNTDVSLFCRYALDGNVQFVVELGWWKQYRLGVWMTVPLHHSVLFLPLLHPQSTWIFLEARLTDNIEITRRKVAVYYKNKNAVDVKEL